MILFFDTETTGLPNDWDAPITDFENWPRMVQIAYILCDYDEKVIKKYDYLIKPNGFVITKESTAIHGITTEKAYEEGVEIEIVLEEIRSVIMEADYLVAHNINYDKNILGAEFLRNGMQNILDDKEAICTMESATDICAISTPYGFKWPTLSEMHLTLFETTFEEAHNACIDISITSKCFWELASLGIIDIDYSKNTKLNHSTKINVLDLPELIPFKKGNKWGFCDREKIIKIDCKYDLVSLFKDNNSIVKFKNKAGCIDRSEKVIIDFLYDEISPFVDGYAKIKLADKFGYVNDKGEVISEIIYDEIFLFNDNLARFRIKDKFGFLNKRGKVIIEPKYQWAQDFSDGFAIIRFNNFFGFIDSSDNLTLLKFCGIKNISNFKSGFAEIEMYYKGNLKEVTKKNIIDFEIPLSDPSDKEEYYIYGFGIIDSLGNIVIDAVYNKIRRLPNGYYYVENICNLDGHETVTIENYLQPNGLMVETIYDNKFIFDKKTDFLINYEESGDEIIKEFESKSQIHIDKDFFPTTWDENENSPYGSREYYLTNKITILDENLETLLLLICSEGKYGFNKNGYISESIFSSYEETRWALADSDGKKITDFNYTEINYNRFKEELLALRNLENEWGIVDLKGKVLVDFKYLDLKYNNEYKDLIEVPLYKDCVDFGEHTYYKGYINILGMEYWEDEITLVI